MGIGPWEILVILFVIILVFGGKKLPELARGLGLGLKEFKKATKDIKDEVENATKEVEDGSNLLILYYKFLVLAIEVDIVDGLGCHF